MKREKPHKRGTQNREPVSNALNAAGINPACPPLDPAVLNTGAASEQVAAEYVPPSEPLEEKPATTGAVTEGIGEKREQDQERKSGAAGEFYKPNTPLEEQPLSGSATRRRMKATTHRRNSTPPRKSPRRASR